MKRKANETNHGLVVILGALLLCSIGQGHADGSMDQSYHDLDVFELVMEGNTETLAEVLAIRLEDPNIRSGDGSSMIYIASKYGQAGVVDVLLQAGAQVDHPHLHSGNSSLLVSVMQGELEIAKLLLAYGANMDHRNKAGDSPRSLIEELEERGESGSDQFSKLVALYDKDGPMAFEDPPGTWQLFTEANRNYYQNLYTQESRWSVPPSCAWNRRKKESGLFAYANKVSGQVSWQLPPALSWKFVLHKELDKAMWYNFRTERLQTEVPGELPQYLMDELMDNANTFWFNEATGEMKWENPEVVSWKEVESEKGTFWFNEVTGRTQWEEPVDLAWKEAFSETKGEKYYWNEFTGEATFGKPEPLAWAMKQEL